MNNVYNDGMGSTTMGQLGRGPYGRATTIHDTNQHETDDLRHAIGCDLSHTYVMSTLGPQHLERQMRRQTDN